MFIAFLSIVVALISITCFFFEKEKTALIICVVAIMVYFSVPIGRALDTTPEEYKVQRAMIVKTINSTRGFDNEIFYKVENFNANLTEEKDNAIDFILGTYRSEEIFKIDCIDYEFKGDYYGQ